MLSSGSNTLSPNLAIRELCVLFSCASPESTLPFELLLFTASGFRLLSHFIIAIAVSGSSGNVSLMSFIILSSVQLIFTSIWTTSFSGSSA